MTVTQIVGEKKIYRAVVGAGVVTGATWTVSPTGPTVTEDEETSEYVQAFFQTSTPGKYALTAVVTTEDGQIHKSRTYIMVTN